MSDEERIHSAHCSCRGGIDGYCRHVAATLFEMMHFNDEHTTSCTSEPCLWRKRKTWAEQPVQPVEVTSLQTSIILDEENTLSESQSSENVALPTPCPNRFFSGLTAVAPKACILKLVFVQQVEDTDQCSLEVKTPLEKIDHFKNVHTCTSTSDCDCCGEYVKQLTYSCEEIDHTIRPGNTNVVFCALKK